MRFFGECHVCGNPQAVSADDASEVRCQICGGELRVDSVEFKNADERVNLLTQAARTPGR